MTSFKQHKPSVPATHEPATQRPKTLFQRLSSGIINGLPPFRASTPTDDLIGRPTTASSLASERKEIATVAAESEQLHVAPVSADIAAQFEQPCPYDPNAYHSFASIGKRRCSLCGMRGPKIVFNDPCEACRTGGPGSHIPSARRQDAHRRHSTIEPRQLAYFADSSSSLLVGPRPVTPERAAKRIGNPPRVSRLPPGIVRLPVPNTQQQNAASASPSRLGALSPTGARDIESIVSDARARPMQKPASPKLHHIRGLPGSDNFPFVHRHEVSKHAIALCAGSTSPLTDRSQSPKSPSSTNRPPDHSGTVQYGSRESPSPVGQASTPRPLVTTVVVREVQESGEAVVDLHASPLNSVLAGSHVYRKRHSGQPAKSSAALVDVTDSGTTFGSQNTGSTRRGGMRIELRGGNPVTNASPRLRGGSGHEWSSTNTFSFKLKRWLLTCHGPCPDDFDSDSDADLPPPRVVSPERVARTRERMNGRAPLPAHLCRATQARTPPASNDRPGTESIPPLTSFTTTICSPSRRNKNSLLSHSLPSLFNRRSNSPINQSAPIPPTQVLNPPFPHLRGGAGSPERVPPTLFWLAGGTGRKPISICGWKESRPKQRMSGLCGMAVFGRRYGQAYGVEARVEEEMEVDCSASVNFVVDKTAAGDGEGSAEKLGVTESSNSSSITSVVPEPVEEITTGTNNVAPTADVGSAHGGLTPTYSERVDDVPLCSGVLPVESAEDQQAATSAQVASADASEAQCVPAEVDKESKS